MLPRPNRPANPAQRARRCVASLALGLCAAVALPAPATPASSSETAQALQIVADVVLVESECRDLNVDYAKLFAFAERNGIEPVDVMPLGARRSAFDAAYRKRALEIPGEQLCTEFAGTLADTVPGVFKPR